MTNKKFLHRYIPMFISVVLIVLAAAAYFIFRPSTPTAEAGWYSTGGTWSYRKAITIDHNKVTGTTTPLTNFPMLFNVTDADLKFTGSGGKVASSTGFDILFTSSDGTTKLSHEIEKYASTTGETVAWIKIPSLSPTTDTVIYIYFGNASASDQQDAVNVWDTNFKGVWHLPNGTALSANDSTSYAHNGAAQGTVSAVAGQVDGAASFNGNSSNYILGANSTDYNLTSAATWSAWVKTTAVAAGNIIDRDDPATAREFQFRVESNGTLGLVLFTAAGATLYTPTTTGTVNNGNWHYVVTTYDGSNIRLYIDGIEDSAPAAVGGNINSGTGTTLKIGRYGGDTTQPFNGTIDESRLSSTNRTAAWIATEYNNQSSPSTFYAYSATQVETRAASTAGVKVRGGGAPSINFIEVVSGDFPNTANGTITVTLGTPTAAGDALLIMAEVWGTSSNGVSGITDTAGQAYATTTNWNNVRPTAAGGYMFSGYVLNSAAGVTSVTVRQNANAGGGKVWVYHVSGLASSSALDQSPAPTGPTNTPWSGPSGGVATSQASEFAIGLSKGTYNGGNCSATVSGSWNSGGVDNNDAGNGSQGISGYQILSSTASGLQFTGTDTGTCDHVVGVVTFKGLTPTPAVKIRGGTPSIALVSHVSAQNVGTFTTSSINTTGATLLVAVVTSAGGVYTLTDSNGNTWTSLTTQTFQTGPTKVETLFYVANPTVGTSHTFTLTGSPPSASICAAAFKGVITISPLDQNTGSTVSDSTTIQPGSVTPTQNNELIVSGVGANAGDPSSIDSSFTITDHLPLLFGFVPGCGLAYIIQTTAGTTNPTWTNGSSGKMGGTNATFKINPSFPAGVKFR